MEQRAPWSYRKEEDEEDEAMGAISRDPASHDEFWKQTLGKVGVKTSKEARRHLIIEIIGMVSKVERRMDRVKGSKHKILPCGYNHKEE